MKRPIISIWMFLILQWNARSLSANGQELKRFVGTFKDKPDLICIQETWLKPHLDFVIPGYDSLRADRMGKSGGGCATFIKTGLQFRRLDLKSNLEIVAVEVWSSRGQITLINFYNPGNMMLSDLDEIMNKVRSPVIWVGDFNAHNPIWGSESKDSNGVVVEEFLDKYNMVLLNDGRPTRFNIVKNTCSHLDLSITSSNLARVGEWDVMDRYTLGSDHYPILCRFGRNLIVEVEERSARYNFSLAQWDEYQEKAVDIIEEINSEGSIDDWNESLCSIIHKVAQLTIPLRNVPKARALVPWWNKNCDIAVRNRNRAYRKLRKYPVLDNVMEYKKERAVARRVIKNAKRDSWRSFCGTLSPETPIKQLWMIIHRMSGIYRKPSIPALLEGDIEAVTNKEKADVFVEVFQALHSSGELGDLRKEIMLKESWKLDRSLDDNSSINLFFSLQELQEAVQSGSNTSPGRDGLCYELLKHLDDSVLIEILALFNSVWKEGKLPVEWKHAVVVPVLKPGKDASSPSSYRPIALTSVLCKIMERMVTNRLVYFLENKGHFAAYQNGFRTGRSTMESVALLDHDIKKAFQNREVMVSVFLDIERAYDSLWKDGLLIKLYDAGIRGRMFNWIKDFLKERTIQVRIGGTSSKSVKIGNGTPQGSVISPVLFNVMINDIFDQVGTGFGKSLFADDGAIWKRGRNIKYILRQVQKALRSVENWANKWGFRISVSKSKYMIFGFRRKIPDYELCLYDSPLEKVKVFKFLGVWFDERLTWRVHIDKTIGKCEKVLNVMRSIAGCDWGAGRETMYLIYLAMIRSVIDYGSIAYGSAATAVLGKLDTVQSKALRLCCGAFRTTSVPALCVEMGEVPLHLRRIQLGLQYWAKRNGFNHRCPSKCLLQGKSERQSKIKRYPFLDLVNNWAVKLKLTEEDIVDQICLSPVPIWLLPEPVVDLFLLFQLQGSSAISSVLITNEYLNNKWGSYLKIFTDGSVDPESSRAGFGMYVSQLGVKIGHRVSDGVSVFATELLAILWALWWIEDSRPCRVIICSDSAAALEAIKGNKSKARPDIVIEILLVLFRVGKMGCAVRFLWIPGHAGVEGNEIVDGIAKSSLQSRQAEIRVPLGRAELRSRIKKGIEKKWQEDWKNELKGRHYFASHPLVKKVSDSYLLNRRDRVKLTRLRLGHCGLNYYLKIMGKHPTGLCDCGSPETVQHVLLSCNRYKVERSMLFKRLSGLNIFWFSIKSLFGHQENQQLIEEFIIQFIRETRLYSRI